MVCISGLLVPLSRSHDDQPGHDSDLVWWYIYNPHSFKDTCLVDVSERGPNVLTYI